MSSRTPTSAAAQSSPIAIAPIDLDHQVSAKLIARSIDTAQVVGIGESAHFVSEFNVVRAAVVADLVAIGGVTHLALEVGADEAPAVDAWIRREHDGELIDMVGPLTHCLYGTFLNELRDRLATDHGLRVVGVDLPNSLTIEPSLTPLVELVETLDPEAADLVTDARRLASQVTGGSAAASAVSWMGLDRSVQDRLTVALARLEGRLRALAPVHAGDDDEAWHTAIDLARSASTTDLMLRAMAELFSGRGHVTDTTLREHFVAARFLEIVERAGSASRFAYVAHNNHIQKTPVSFDGELTAYPVGLMLSNALGHRYRAVALTHLGSTVPEMAVPADTPVGFEVETVAVEEPRASSVEAVAARRASGGTAQLVIVGEAHDTVSSIRSQSAVSDITTESFDAFIVVGEASVDPAVEYVLKPG